MSVNESLRRRTITRYVVFGFVSALMLAGCAPSSSPVEETQGSHPALGISDEGFTLEALIEAAQDEGRLTVSDSTGKIVDMAEAFSEKYGIEAVGVKVEGADAIEVAIRESESGNVTTDVFLLNDAPAAVTELADRGITTSWTPPDLVDTIPSEFQNPLVITNNFVVWAYNTELHGDTCPVDNLWALTEEEWRGHVAIQDPALKQHLFYWASQMATHRDAEMSEAYEDYFGESFSSEEDSATAEWLKRLAQNSPLLSKSDNDAAEAAGAPGQTESFIGLMSTAKFRENEDNGYALGLCAGLDPYVGIGYAKVGLIANGTNHPNAAKLFIHYVMTEEGIWPQQVDGKFSTNPDVPNDPDEPSGILSVWDETFRPDPSTYDVDFDSLQDWNDFWLVNKRS